MESGVNAWEYKYKFSLNLRGHEMESIPTLSLLDLEEEVEALSTSLIEWGKNNFTLNT